MALAKYEKPASILECAIRLNDLGYWPVPIPAGCKGPTLDGWQNLRITFDNADQYFSETGMLIGILHKNVLAFDIDVYDPALAQIMVAEGLRRFPGALERIGQDPKSALFLRMEEPGFKIKSTEKHSKDGITAQVEVRSVTRQIVAYGKHPETKQPYRWPRGELWETPWLDLPEAKQDDVQRFRDWCNEQIRKWAGASDPKIIDLGNYSAPRTFADEKISEEGFLEALSHIPASVGYEDWISVLMGIHDYFAGSQRGLDVANDWSSAYPDYTAQEVAQKWRSFEVGKGSTYKTVLHFAKQNGANLAALAKPVASTFQIDTGRAEQQDNTGDADAVEPDKDGLEWFDDVQPNLSDTYLIKGVLAAGAMSVIYGPSNSGKTFKALDIAFHLAAGLPWRERRVTQCAVLYLAAEGGKGVINRIAALKMHTGASDIPLAVRRAGLDLLKSEADLQNVYDLAQKVQARAAGAPLLIVIDTLSRVMAGGDENAPGDMTALIKNIDLIREATSAHVMLVHHTGKDAAKGARGHSSLRAATDTEIEVQSEGDARAALMTKQRDYQGGETFAFSLKSISLGIDPDGDEVTSCVVIEAEPEDFAKAKKKPGKNQKVLLETFDQMIGEGLWKPNPSGVGMPEAGRFKAVQMEDFRAECEGRLVAKNTRDAFLTAFDGMLEPNGPFVLASGFVWRTDRKNTQ